MHFQVKIFDICRLYGRTRRFSHIAIITRILCILHALIGVLCEIYYKYTESDQKINQR